MVRVGGVVLDREQETFARDDCCRNMRVEAKRRLDRDRYSEVACLVDQPLLVLLTTTMKEVVPSLVFDTSFDASSRYENHGFPNPPV